jgi:hypothetical protein
MSMGKVYDEDGTAFRDIWNSPEYRRLRQTVNDDQSEKYFPYCRRCEYRYGWSDLEQHVGYSEWAETIAGDDGRVAAIDHRREKRAVPGAKGEPLRPGT